MNTFKAGDVVRFKSGGPDMVVEEINYKVETVSKKTDEIYSVDVTFYNPDTKDSYYQVKSVNVKPVSIELVKAGA